MKGLRTRLLLWWRYGRHGKAPTLEQAADVMVETGELAAADRAALVSAARLQAAADAFRELGRRFGRGER